MSIIRMKTKISPSGCSIDPDVWLEFMEGELSSSHKADLDLHRQSCKSCSAQLKELRVVRNLIRDSSPKELPGLEVFNRLESAIMARIQPNIIEKAQQPWQSKKYYIPLASAAALILLVVGALLRSPTLVSKTGPQQLAQNRLEDQYLTQAAYHNPEIVSHSMISSQDEDDLVLDATAEKMAHMSDAQIRAMMAQLK